jgi:predicted nucleic acid-binding protein
VPPPYAADTNVYVRAANEPSFRGRLERFVQEAGPLLVSSVVIAEVLIGVTEAGRHDAVIRALSAGTTPLAPQPDDWIAAATAVCRLGGDTITKSRSFWNDALLAAQCSRLQVTMITSNAKDFRRLARHLPVEVLEPFPA